MLLRLQKYDITLEYKQGQDMLLADALSRAYLKDTEEEIEEDEIIAHIHMLKNSISVSDKVMKEIAIGTQMDPELLKLK